MADRKKSLTSFEISVPVEINIPVTFSVSGSESQEKKLNRLRGIARSDGKIIRKGLSSDLKKEILEDLGVKNGKELNSSYKSIADLNSEIATEIAYLLFEKKGLKKRRSIDPYRKMSEYYLMPKVDKIIQEDEKKEENAKKV